MGMLDTARQANTEFAASYNSVYQRFLEAMAHTETPEEASCFPLCDVLARRQPDGNGFALLGGLDVDCGTTYQYPHFCTETDNLLAESGETAETLYFALVARYGALCGIAGIPFPDFPSTNYCDYFQLVLGSTTTVSEMVAAADSCGITIEPEYTWTEQSVLTAGQDGWVAWSSVPYANFPDTRTRFSWSSGNGLVTTYGTPGGGSPTNRHYLYGKKQYGQALYTIVEVTYRCPSGITGTDQRFNVFLGNLGTLVHTSPSLPMIADGSDHTVTLNYGTGTTADLVALAVLGGTGAGDAAVQIRDVKVRGTGTPP